MPDDLAPIAPYSQGGDMKMLADAPWQDAPSDDEIDAMYADWCARHGVDPDKHKDHHYWVA